MLEYGANELVMRKHGGLANFGIVLYAGKAVWKPIRQAKVDRLADIEAVIKACVVGPGKGDDKFPCSLIAGRDPNTFRFQSIWTKQCDLYLTT